MEQIAYDETKRTDVEANAVRINAEDNVDVIQSMLVILCLKMSLRSVLVFVLY